RRATPRDRVRRGRAAAVRGPGIRACPGSLGAAEPRTRLPDEGAVPGVRQDGHVEVVVSWFVLIVSGVLAAVWATALGRSNCLSRLVPAAVFLVALLLRMAGLAYAMREIPPGTSYVVWVGVGAVLTVAIAMATGDETASVPKVLLLAAIVGSVIGLKLTR